MCKSKRASARNLSNATSSHACGALRCTRMRRQRRDDIAAVLKVFQDTRARRLHGCGQPRDFVDRWRQVYLARRSRTRPRRSLSPKHPKSPCKALKTPHGHRMTVRRPPACTARRTTLHIPLGGLTTHPARVASISALRCTKPSKGPQAQAVNTARPSWLASALPSASPAHRCAHPTWHPSAAQVSDPQTVAAGPTAPLATLTLRSTLRCPIPRDLAHRKRRRLQRLVLFAQCAVADAAAEAAGCPSRARALPLPERSSAAPEAQPREWAAAPAGRCVCLAAHTHSRPHQRCGGAAASHAAPLPLPSTCKCWLSRSRDWHRTYGSRHSNPEMVNPRPHARAEMSNPHHLPSM